ncbi:unnamed protein product [Urochloa humidicola]
MPPAPPRLLQSQPSRRLLPQAAQKQTTRRAAAAHSRAVQSGGGGGVNLAISGRPVSSRDGLLLLKLKGRETSNGLCLYNSITGDRTFFPAASAFVPDAYVLVTGYDLLPVSAAGDEDDDDMGVRVVAVRQEYITRTVRLIFRHQQISPTSGGGAAAWGPDQRSPKFTVNNLHTFILPGNEVVCGGAIHWLGGLRTYNQFNRRAGEVQSFALAIDVRTGRTWATKLPDQCRYGYYSDSLVLATSGDGRLSVVNDCRASDVGDCIQVWVLVGGDEWALQRSVAVPAMGIRMPLWKNSIVFCPRSGCVLVEVEGGDLVIEVVTGFCNRIRYLKNMVPRVRDLGDGGYRYPFEMDWPTYLSRLKHF